MNFSRWHNRLKYLWLFVILLLIGTVTFWYQNNKINIQNDIYSLLPEQIFPAEINQSSKEIMDKLGSKLFVMLESSSEKDLNASTQFLAQKVKGIDWIKEISFPDFKTGYQTIFQYRNNLLSTSDKNLLKEQDYESLIDASLLKLYSPGTILSDDLLKQDPFLFFSSFVFEQLEFQAVKSHIEMIDAYPTIHNDDQWHRLLMFEVNGNVMDVAFQEKILPVFESIKQDVATSYHSKIFATGFLLFSISGTQSAKSEISIISWGSILGLILLIIIGFKSIRPIFTELTAITSGFLLAFVLTHSLFGEIHLLTLVFGASLIGISIDFSFYYLFTQSGNRELTALELLAQLMPILLMSLITTLLAYLCLYFTGLVGLQQIAIFSIFGLIGAWVTNFFLLPQLPALDTGLVQKIFYFLPKIRAYCLQNKRVVNLFLGVVLFLSVGGIFYLQADDNVQSLQAKNSELVAQQEAIQKWFGEQNLNQYFIVTGQDENNIVLQEYLLLNELKKLQKQKMISQINAIGLWVLPQSIQLENNQLIQNIPDDALSNYAELSGLSYQQLRDWKKEVENLKILTLDDIKDILMLSDLKLSNGARVILVDSDQIDVLQALANQFKQVFYVNTGYYLSELFKDYWIKAEIQLGIAIAILCLLMCVVYGLKVGIRLMTPVIIALLAAYSTLSVLNYSINLFSIMPAFLILGIGVDYTIYFYSNNLKNSLTSIALLFCMLTSIIGFGLLALSSTYAVKSFGMLILFGVLYSYIFAFISIPPKCLND